MSNTFGAIFQVAYVVPDIEAAIDHWTQVMGVGPFVRFPLPLPLEWLRIDDRDARIDTDLLRGVALSYSGETMIELIDPAARPRATAASSTRGSRACTTSAPLLIAMTSR